MSCQSCESKTPQTDAVFFRIYKVALALGDYLKVRAHACIGGFRRMGAWGYVPHIMINGDVMMKTYAVSYGIIVDLFQMLHQNKSF